MATKTFSPNMVKTAYDATIPNAWASEYALPSSSEYLMTIQGAPPILVYRFASAGISDMLKINGLSIRYSPRVSGVYTATIRVATSLTTFPSTTISGSTTIGTLGVSPMGQGKDVTVSLGSFNGASLLSKIGTASTWYILVTHSTEKLFAKAGPFDLIFDYESATTRINSGGVWKSAVPYLNSAGTWKMTMGWVNVGGTWKQGQ